MCVRVFESVSFSLCVCVCVCRCACVMCACAFVVWSICVYVYVRAAVCVRARLCMYACVVVTVVGIVNVAVLIGCQRTQSSHIPVVVLFWLMRENMIAVVGPSNKTHLNKSTMQTYNECVEACREQKRTDARSENKLKG